MRYVINVARQTWYDNNSWVGDAKSEAFIEDGRTRRAEDSGSAFDVDDGEEVEDPKLADFRIQVWVCKAEDQDPRSNDLSDGKRVYAETRYYTLAKLDT